jgi:multidrug efflux pump subunit AcrA (membrane-fusion protein)
MGDYISRNESQLENAQRNMAYSQNQLRTAQNNLRSAQESLNQISDRPAAADTNVELQQINLERLNRQLAEGVILAPVSGVVTQINASVGAAASGVLFIIEDVDNLYVAANVREHSLGELSIGQQTFVTTEITGDSVYDAEIIFISPRSVSPVGSTSVEFEIHAAMNGNDDNVRIGMNAFINVVTDYREDIFAVPLSAIVATERGSFVIMREGEEMREIPVTVGLRTSTHAEIYGEHLREGMAIIARPGEMTAETGGNGGIRGGRGSRGAN